jgi:UDP-4-amino-4,6-dideoxy-N-acetyl-beta-L-altrosamine N-acetyltransferase
MRLRKLTENDLPLILTWRNNPDVRRFMYNNHAITKDEHQEWFARMEQNPQSLWYIHEDQKGNPDGVVYFTQYQIERKNAFWGFYAAPCAPAGTGIRLGLDALNEAFDVLRLHKLNTEVLSANERSLRFHNKLGFRSEGVFRESHFDGENFIDVIRFGILQSEWLEKHLDVEQRIAKLDVIAKTTSSGG